MGAPMTPLAVREAVARRARRIAEAWLSGGLTQSELAREFGVSTRTVERAVARWAPGAPRQPFRGNQHRPLCQGCLRGHQYCQCGAGEGGGAT